MGDSAAGPRSASLEGGIKLSHPVRLLRLASPLAGILCFALAFWSLQRSPLGEYGFNQITAALAAMPGMRLAAALLLTCGGYLALIGYDLLAFRFIRQAMALKGMATASLVASALSFNLGNTALTGAALRYWIYSSLGLSGTQIARVAVFCSAGFWLGFVFLGALLFSFGRLELPEGLSLDSGSTRSLGLFFLALIAAYLAVAAMGRPLRLGRWRLHLPSPALTIGQILVASFDLCLMAGVLYVLLPPGGDLSYFRFLPMFLVGLIGSTVSQVPGGLGVFETVMALLLVPWFDPEELAAALLAFRGIYFILPLFLSLGFVGVRQGLPHLPGLSRWARRLGLRLAAVASVSISAFSALCRLVRPGNPVLPLPDAGELEKVRSLIGGFPETYGNLALRSDKALLFSRAGDAFLMYGRQGRTWAAMGDPIGSEAGIREVVRRFRDLAEDAGGWCAFFEVRRERRDFYAGLGLTLTQLGEEARVYLPGFNLDGHHFKPLRRVRAKLARQGCRFEIFPREEVAKALPALKRISDAWLAAKPTAEKGFCTASFDGDYLCNFPVAVVRQGGEILAFANLWPGAGKEELSFDLMRHLPGAPHGTMDFLFTELLLWGRDEGYRWFNFGMAPLAGIPGPDSQEHPVWSLVAAFLYRRCQRFYNFEGLRRYKDKFRPVWTPLYLASPGGAALGPILVDITALMAGGPWGIVAKK